LMVYILLGAKVSKLHNHTQAPSCNSYHL